MPFEPPKPPTKLTKEERAELLTKYVDHYRRVAQEDPSALNRKLPRKAFDDLLDSVGELLLTKSRSIAKQSEEIRRFLDENSLPEGLAEHLPDDVRVYCLALNALKVWVSAEQARTDRYLLGANARTECRAATTHCLVTGESLHGNDIDLHHPVRDGRPSIPLSKEGHKLIENQNRKMNADAIDSKLVALRGRNRSWAQLRRGCLDRLGQNPIHSTPKMRASARSFALKAHRDTGWSYSELLEWLDRKNLGRNE